MSGSQVPQLNPDKTGKDEEVEKKEEVEQKVKEEEEEEEEEGGGGDQEEGEGGASEEREAASDGGKEEPHIFGEDSVKREHKALCRDMFSKVTEYLNGELAATSEEYELLHRLNQMTLAKYQDMTALASRLNEVSQRLNDKFISLQPYCDQIDQVEASVSALEQTAYRLDAYCKRLEGKFRDLEKR